MKNKKFLSVALIVTIGFYYTSFIKESTIETSRKQHTNLIKNHPFYKRMHMSKKDRKLQGLPPNAYYEQEYLNEINPNTGRTHPENYIRLQQELKTQKRNQRTPGDANNNPWVERGPNNVGGRTRALIFDPNDPLHKRVFAGGVSGGLWVNNDITDVNTSWTSVGIDENLSITCITVDPNNSQIMYLGTGESYGYDQAIGNGVWKSTDGGATWINVFSDSFNTNIAQRLFYINTIKAWNNPSTNQTEVFIGVGGSYYTQGAQWVGYEKAGLYKTADYGTTWTQQSLPAIPGSGSEYEPNDLEIGPDNTIWIGTERNAYGNGGGTILKSTDGTNFSVAHTVTDGRRTEIAISSSNADKIYVLHQTSNNPKMLVTTDGFATTTEIITPADADTGIPDADFTRGQSGYDLLLAVDPTDDTQVYVGGIDLFRSADLGARFGSDVWEQISKWSNNNNLAALTIPVVHADQHTFVFHPTDSNKAIIGNDGGVFYASSLSTATTTATAISVRNKDYNVTQFYNGAIGQDVNTDQLLAGAQDNGTQFIDGATPGINSSVEVFGGDGAYSFIDKDGAYVISSYVYNYKGSSPLPYTGSYILIDDDLDSGSFINAQELDDNLDILYSNAFSSDTGNSSIAKYIDLTATPTRTNFTTATLNNNATALKVSPFTTGSSKLYVGTAVGKLFKVENANSTPVWTNIGDASFSGSISSISFGATEDEILVSFHNYGVVSMWFTEDGGTTWANKEGDFADIPVKAMMMNPLNNDEVIIGTQLGVWRTENFKDAAPNWVQSSNGMSDVKVTSFSLRTADNTVLATSYGRGMFTGQFTATTSSIDDVFTDKKVFTVYPTISDGNFTLFAKNSLGNSKLQVFDIRGKEVHNQKIDFDVQEKQQISVNLKPGIYIINLIDANNKKSSSKIIIE